MSKQKIIRSQPSKENLSSVGEFSVDSENSTHFFLSDQNQKSVDFDKTIEDQNNQNENNVFDENQIFSPSAFSHM